MDNSLPPIICGPFVRKLEATSVVIWFCTLHEARPYVALQCQQQKLNVNQNANSIRLGTRCFVHLVEITHTDGAWPEQQNIQYQVIDANNEQVLEHGIKPLAQQDELNFIYKEKLTTVYQGSCRKPEHKSPDAFQGIVQFVESGEGNRPDYLIMAGDQIYADDVAAPMLIACQTLSDKLGLNSAVYPNAQYSKEELDWHQCLDQRQAMLPKKQDQNFWQKYWHGDNIVSSRFHDNHLMALDEFFACYLLTWSSTAWQLVFDDVDLAVSQLVSNTMAQQDWQNLKGFIETLPKFETLISCTPSVMIFDDHDVTDDWNLSADWEHHIYGNDLTRHMIRDALFSYSIFQGWGNDPQRITPIIELAKEVDNFANAALTEMLLEFSHWHYEVETTPKIVVLDTRTHRWRSESSLKNPSGLMDWERLEHLEKQLFSAQKSVLVVSAAPVFGVKSIEVVQSMCEMMGKELLVDVENWMAHKGAAKKLMSSLRHDNAPDEVIILSGDVHYSFCFSAQRRFSSTTDKIWQLTCSGFKNEFPQKLLKFFDYIDRVLYSRYSLLNVFTKRRKLAIEHHPLFEPSMPNKKGKQRHLHSESAAGLVELSDEGLLKSFSLITAKGEKLHFELDED